MVPRKLCRGSYSYICSSVHPVNVTIHSSCNNYLNHQSKQLLINRTIIFKSSRILYCKLHTMYVDIFTFTGGLAIRGEGFVMHVSFIHFWF